MKIVLLDNSVNVKERLQKLAAYTPEHYETLLELAGMHPDWVVVDAAQGPEVVHELQEEWGLLTCVVTPHVTLQLRRSFPRVKHLISDAQLQEFFEEQQKQSEEQSPFASVSEETTSTVQKTTLVESQPILHSVRESVESMEHRNRRAKIYAVGPLRNTGGGAGKTAFVSNFAAYAAKQDLSVLVIDLDPNGVLGTLVDAQGELNVAYWEHLMNQNPNAKMTERAVQESVEHHPVFHFSLISSATKASVIAPKVLSWILTQTQQYFDIILVDTPAMWADSIVLMMQEADQVILIGLHDPAQYPHYKATLEIMTSPIMPVGISATRIRVIISRAYLGKNREVEMEEIGRQLDIPLSLIIPEDPRFYSYRETHKAIVLEKPASEYSKAVIPWFEKQISELKGGQNLPAIYTDVRENRKTRESLFTRLFGGGKKTQKIMKRA